jgi:hypothetical protein
MSVMDIVHGDYELPDKKLQSSLATGIRMAVKTPDGTPLTDSEIGTLLIVAGSRMVLWEANDGNN